MIGLIQPSHSFPVRTTTIQLYTCNAISFSAWKDDEKVNCGFEIPKTVKNDNLLGTWGNQITQMKNVYHNFSAKANK